MPKLKSLHLKLAFIYVALFLIGLVAAFYSFNNYIYQQKQPDENESADPYEATLVGVYTCLPKKDTGGEHTLECALGLKTDSNEYYALDLNQIPDQSLDIPTGKRISTKGIVTPIENLSTDRWRTYDIEGIFTVTEGPEVVE